MRKYCAGVVARVIGKAQCSGVGIVLSTSILIMFMFACGLVSVTVFFR